MQQICCQVIQGAGITFSLGEAWKAMLGQTRFYESYWDRLIFGFREPRQQQHFVPEITTPTFSMLLSLSRLLHRVFRFSVICGGKVDWLSRRFVAGLSRPFVAGTERRAKTCLHASCLLLFFAVAAFVASLCHHVVERWIHCLGLFGGARQTCQKFAHTLMDWLSRPFVAGLFRFFVPERRAKICLHASSLFFFTVAFFVVSFCHHVVERWIHRLGLSWRG